jgi:hypothetical protein
MWHFGLEFEETCHNIGYHIQAVWTKDNVDPGYSPMYGFEVRDGYPTPERQKIRIENYSTVETMPIEMQVMVLTPQEAETFPLEDLNTSFFDSNSTWNNRWVTVPTYMLPTYLPGDGSPQSFFDVFLDQLGPGGLVIPPGGGLMAREYSSYQGGSTDYFWNYELHQAHTPEPGTMVLLAVGAAALLLWRWRRSA